MNESGDRDYETSTNAYASFRCLDCGQEFKSLQELKEQRF
jgi:hypothetical protein